MGFDITFFGRLIHTCDTIFLCVCSFIMDLCRHSGPYCEVLNDIYSELERMWKEAVAV